MNTKPSIVTSAADGYGKPLSIRSMDNSHRSQREQKESFVLSNHLSISHSLSLVAAGFAAISLVSSGFIAHGAAAYSVTGLGFLSGDNLSIASAINDNGQVVGVSVNSSSSGCNAFLYNNGTMTELGTLGGSASYARAINDNGQIVGYSTTSSGDKHAFQYSNGTMTDLDILGGSASYASAINDNGQVVGISMTITGAYHAFLYNGSTMQDLNSLISPGSGWILNTAYSINNLGDIVGAGTYNNNYEAFLLVPAVPVPDTLSLIGIGSLVLISGMALRRRLATTKI